MLVVYISKAKACKYFFHFIALRVGKISLLYHLCKSQGWHVQKSVFEFDIDYGALKRLEHKISKIIDKELDSVRIYYLGKQRTDTNVILLGKRELVESNDVSIIL